MGVEEAMRSKNLSHQKDLNHHFVTCAKNESNTGANS